jgi:hypothetical protein
MSGIFLKDGSRVVGADGTVTDDLAHQAVRAVVDKTFRAATKKFSKMTLIVLGSRVSAWDLFCHGSFRSAGAFRDVLISDFMLFSVHRCINGMSEEMRCLIEMSACGSKRQGDGEKLNREIVSAVIVAELQILVREHGQMVHALYDASASAARVAHNVAIASCQSSLNGASPL